MLSVRNGIASSPCWAPAGTPHEIVARLQKEIAAVLNTAETKERFASDGSEVLASTPEAFAALIKAELARWVSVVKSAGMERM